MYFEFLVLNKTTKKKKEESKRERKNCAKIKEKKKRKEKKKDKKISKTLGSKYSSNFILVKIDKSDNLVFTFSLTIFSLRNRSEKFGEHN